MWDKDTVIHLSPLKNFVFPSFQMAEKIKGILAERKQNPFIEKGLYPKPSVFSVHPNMKKGLQKN